MYSRILYFVVAVILYTARQPGEKAALPPLETAGLALALFLAYFLLCRAIFTRMRIRALRGTPEAVLSAAYHRAEARLSILALLCVAVHVYVLDIKFYLNGSWLQESLSLSGLSGLVLYLVHLTAMWHESHSIFQYLYRSAQSRAAYLRANLAFSSAILVPWFLVALAFDLLRIPELPSVLKGEAGQIAMMGTAMLLFVLFAPWPIVRLWGCKTLPPGPARTELENFCAEHRFRIGDLKTWPLFGGEILTAGVVGVLPGMRYILFTKSILTLLNVEELKAVTAHEMGHVRRHHLLLYLVFFMVFAILTTVVGEYILLLGLKSGILLRASPNSDILSAVYIASILFMLIIYFRFIFGFFLRNSERQADLYAMGLIGHPYTLVSSLQKIGFYSGRIEDLPNWHHYGIAERCEFLMRAFREPSLVTRHHRKLYSAIAAFLILATGLTVVGLSSGSSQFKRSLLRDIQVDLLEQALHRRPASPEIYAAYGGALYEVGKYAEAESALRKALAMAPENPGILNNLAWLYATSPPPFLKPDAALELASRAATIRQDPHILDTLAEAYYRNGLYEEALETIEKALVKELENRDYFLKQKQKFEEALRNRETGYRRPSKVEAQFSRTFSQ